MAEPNRIAFHGRLATGDYTLAAEAIGAWLGEQPRVRVRLFGEEITYEDQNLELYCHNASSTGEANPRFLLEGNMSASLDVAKSKLRALAVCCRDRGLDAVLEYVEIDEDGNEVNEELAVQLD